MSYAAIFCEAGVGSPQSKPYCMGRCISAVALAVCRITLANRHRDPLYYFHVRHKTPLLPESGATNLENGVKVSKEASDVPALHAWRLVPGLPNMTSIIGKVSNGKAEVIGEQPPRYLMTDRIRSYLTGCGPTSFKVDLSDACMKAQLQVFEGWSGRTVASQRSF